MSQNIYIPDVKVPPSKSTSNAVSLFSWNGLFSFVTMNDFTYTSQMFVRSFAGKLSGNRVYAWPDKSGTIALTSDILPGTVTSVGLALPTSVFSITNSPISSSGTLTGSFISQTANYGFFAPDGVNGAPSFRQMVSRDLLADAAGLLRNNGTGTLSWDNTILTNSLTNDNIWIGNASNIATPQVVSGDATLANTGVLTLATVNANTGTWSDATHVGQFTVNSKGLITAVSSILITPAASSITGGQALTSVNDTNVTLTLGGSPNNSLLVATSLTLGWSGQLSSARGGTGLDSSASIGVAQVSSGTWSISTALANGTTATTQASTDNSTKVATTAYVTTGIANAIAGVNPAVAVLAATTAASDTSSYTYNNGVSGIGATLTGVANTAFTADGVTFTALLQRVLVKNDTQSPSGAFNGVYYVSQLQTALLPPILTRALDYDTPSDINNTGAIPVQSGTVNGSTSWLLTSTVNTVGTDALTYIQFSINPTKIFTTAGTGLTASGNTVSLTTPVSLANGGTNNSLTANNGGILWSDASKLNILAGTSTANQMLVSGATGTPAWTSSTWPTTATTSDLLYASGTNSWARLATANSSVLVTNGSGVPSWNTALPNGVTATTQSNLDNSTKVATTAYIDGQITLGQWIDFSGTAALTNATSKTSEVARYAVIGKTLIIFYTCNFTSTGTTHAITIPFATKRATDRCMGFSYNFNGTSALVSQLSTGVAGSTTLSIFFGLGGGTWPAGTTTGCFIDIPYLILEIA